VFEGGVGALLSLLQDVNSTTATAKITFFISSSLNKYPQ
jgi:hypothetical protein